MTADPHQTDLLLPRRRLRLQDRARRAVRDPQELERLPGAEGADGRHRDGRRRRRLQAQRRAGADRHHRLLHADRRRPVRLRPHRRHQRHLRRLRDGRHADHGAGAGRHADQQAAAGNHRQDHPGGESICAEAGIPIAGGHTIDSVEPIYGLVVLGLVHPSKVKRNADARAGDVLILGKPLGVGVLSAALKKEKLDAAGYAAMIANTTKLNKPGKALAALDGVHALTDVTGFGLLGHLLELARGAKLRRSSTWPTSRCCRREQLAARRLLHRRLRPQLGRLRQEPTSRWRRHHAGAAGAADRPADLGRPAGVLRRRQRRRSAGPVRARRLRRRRRDRPGAPSSTSTTRWRRCSAAWCSA
jgi:hypothetical protein